MSLDGLLALLAPNTCVASAWTAAPFDWGGGGVDAVVDAFGRWSSVTDALPFTLCAGAGVGGFDAGLRSRVVFTTGFGTTAEVWVVVVGVEPPYGWGVTAVTTAVSS